MPATSKAQQAVFGIARSIQKGERPAGSGPSADIAKSVKPKDVEDFASTPTKGLPQRVSNEDIGRIREYVTKVVREIVMKRRMANEDGQGLMKSEAGGKGRAARDPFFKHQLKIARDTLKMSTVGAKIMGGMNHDEARAFLKKHGIPEDARQDYEDYQKRIQKKRKLTEAKFEFEWYEQGRWLTKTITGTEHDANVMLDKIRDRVHTAGEATGNVSYTKVG